MEIRELKRCDLESLLELYIELDDINNEIPLEKSNETWIQIENNNNIKYIGAIDNDRVVSTCYLTIIPNITNNCQSICFIENVVTDKNYRRQGLAKRVLDYAINIAKENNCYKVILQSGVKRSEAHKFYEKIGFNGNTKKAFDMRI